MEHLLDQVKSERKKMAGGEGNKYEEERQERIRRNNEALQKVIAIRRELDNTQEGNPGSGSSDKSKQKRKRTNTTNNMSVQNETGHPNLRPRVTRVSVRSDAEVYDDTEGADTNRGDTCQRHDDQMNNCSIANDELEVDENIGDCSLNGGQAKKKKEGRRYTKKYNIHKRGADERLIQLVINEHGQPVGENAKELSNFIATLVKSKNFSFAHKDWRLVHPSQKLKLWRDLKLFYEVDERVQDWVMGTAAKIWKDFKADLKATHFDETKTDKQLIAICDERVNPADWKWLINHWRSPLAQEHSQRGKANRARMSGLHTTGSKSHARVSHEMKALQDAVKEHPELTEKSITDGDIMSRVFGPERNGYVRSIGNGPTPGDLKMPGRNKYRSTKVQMAMEGQRQAEVDKEHLIQRFGAIRSENDRKIAALTEQVAKLTELMLANSQDGRQVHVTSNSPIHENDQDESDNGETQSEYMQHAKTPSRNATPSQEGYEVGGKEVILYSFIGPHDVPVAKATVLSTNRMTVVGGTPLGAQCCEVVVNLVLKRNAALLRPYGSMNVIADALGRSIAWPLQHMKEDRKSALQRTNHLQGHTHGGR
ncbi:uncharacterized protein LOC102718885 isoform X4 [Oryza brachyantha]|uniref:uncharacterized protein LOC102718885 isoform X4 n=1 Tax=Oryza brachyantha TaxID=4533 RepID=UPI001ADA207A|nr:uncharacterized protein LOC102718885 isoform X4 [Oryza brachyantha]